MAEKSTLRFGARTDEVTSLLRVVHLVRSGKATTRPEIGKVTGLSRGVVTQRVDRAIEMGFLEDAELGPSAGGRAPRVLRFRSERGRILVCALGALHIRVAIAALDGELIDHAHMEWDISQGPEETLPAVTAMLDELLEGTERSTIWAVAVGLPGPVDFDLGTPVAPPTMPGWNGFPIRSYFEDYYGAPVWVDNDVNLLAYGERARRAEDAVDLIYVKIGSGIGAGLLSQGRVHRGMNGAAGDIGHVRVDGDETPCRCGKIGCLEAVAGGWALVKKAEQGIANGKNGILAKVVESGDRLRPATIARAAEDGDAFAISLMQDSARTVGVAIATLVNVFNPGVIVIGGAVAAAGEHYLAEVRQRIYELSLPLATRDLSVINSADDRREPLRGGVELAREQLFEISFPRWFADGQPSIGAIWGR